MGLDLVPLGRPKPRHEEEWERLMKPLYSAVLVEEKPRDCERRNEISILPYEAVGAPRVGDDRAADLWMLQNKPTDIEKPDGEYLTEHKGYYILELLRGKCDGISEYSHAGLYEGVDGTSFRGAFLNECLSLLDKETLERAWAFCMSPEDAAEYGRILLEHASRPEVLTSRGMFGRFFKKRRKTPIEEQRAILNAAGRWYVFWGELGHPISAYF
jgi:hypothetical protein